MLRTLLARALRQPGFRRCEAVGGDAFVAVRPGADAYVLKGVIHDWEDKEAIVMLRTCRAAMSDWSKLLLIERISPSRLTRMTGLREQSSFTTST